MTFCFSTTDGSRTAKARKAESCAQGGRGGDGPHRKGLHKTMRKRPIPNTTRAVEAYLSRCRRDRLLIMSTCPSPKPALACPTAKLTDDELAHLIFTSRRCGRVHDDQL